MAHYYRKNVCRSYVNVAAIFTQPICSKLFTIIRHFVTIAYTWLICKLCIFTWYRLLLCTFISKSASSVAESSPRNPWIGCPNPGGNYNSFSVSRRLDPFSSENCSFYILNTSLVSGFVSKILSTVHWSLLTRRPFCQISYT